MDVKQNVAFSLFFYLDVAGATVANIVCKRSDSAGVGTTITYTTYWTATEDSGGWYRADFAANQNPNLGENKFTFTYTGSNPYDATINTVANIESDTFARIGAYGSSLSSITAIGVSGNVTGSVASVSGAVGSVAGDIAGKVLGGGSGTITAIGANVNTVNINGTAQTAGDLFGTIGIYGHSLTSITAIGVAGNVTGSVGSVTGDVGGKILGGGAGTITAVGARVYDDAGNSVAPKSLLPTALSTGGFMKSDLEAALGSAISETNAGNIAAAIKKFFDILVPVFTTACVNQSADSNTLLTSNAAALGTITSRIGTPVAFDGGTADLAGNLKKIADNSNGTAYVASSDSLHTRPSGGLTAQQTRDAMALATSATIIEGSIDDKIDDLDEKVGTPVALSGGSATLGSMLTKMADNSGGSAYTASSDSMHTKTGSGLTAQQTRDAMGLTPTDNNGQANGLDYKLNNIPTNPFLVSDYRLPEAGTIAIQGNKMDLVDSPNSDAISAFKTGLGLPDGFKKGVAFPNFTIPMFANGDRSAPITGKSVSGLIRKDAGVYGSLMNVISEVNTSGTYAVDLDATETDADLITIIFSATGCDDTIIIINTVA
jgi:hypothetical protein